MKHAPTSSVAEAVFGVHLPQAQEYAELLATDGVVRGVIGPREEPRLWDRHLLNCAVVAEELPSSISVADVGSGAGLPGLVLAIVRPDLTMHLVEPLARRISWLEDCVNRLGLKNVVLHHQRAEEASQSNDALVADVVTARAVAPLGRLARWCLPLIPIGGHLLAMKGSTAPDELARDTEEVRRRGGRPEGIRYCGVDVVDEPTILIDIVKEVSTDKADASGKVARRRLAPAGNSQQRSATTQKKQ